MDIFNFGKSKLRRSILNLYFSHPEKKYYLRELERLLKKPVAYIRREMTHPEGGFYSAQDAGEVGKEGEFYVWSHAELKAALPPGELAAFERPFNQRFLRDLQFRTAFAQFLAEVGDFMDLQTDVVGEDHGLRFAEAVFQLDELRCLLFTCDGHRNEGIGR